MKNLKKVLAFTLALAMVLSTMTTTFAASKEVEALANLKLLLNTTDAEVNQELTRAVGIAMVLKALGYDQEAANQKMGENTFVDMESTSWAKGYAALGEELKITNGTSVEPKMFSPMLNLSEKSFVTFMLRALGYDSDKAWAEAETLAKEAGLVNGEVAAMGSFTKGQAAVIMYNALMAKVQNDDKNRTLAQKLVDENKLDKDLAVANGIINGEPEKLTVSAKADNLIEVVVMFDGTVDKDSAEEAANYKVKGSTVKKAEVQEDGRTVVLTLENAMANKREIKLTVSNVKNNAGVKMDKQEVMFNTNDITAPSVEKVTITGPKSFEVTFSEPIMEMSTAPKLGVATVKYGKTTRSTTPELLPSKRVISYTTYTSFQEGKEYTICIGDGKNNNSYPVDYAKYTTPYFEYDFTYEKDATVPEVKAVKADQSKVTVEFTKPVTGITKDHFYHSFKAYTPVKFEDENGKEISAADAKKSISKIVLVFHDGDKKNSNNHALPAGEVVVTAMGKVGKNAIKDNWGNQLANTDMNVSVSADREAPVVTSVEATGEKEVTVTFSEAILKMEKDNFAFTKDGKKVYISNIGVKDNNKKAVITLSDNYAGKTLNLTVKGLKDASLYENMMVDYETTVDFSDKTLKDVEKVLFDNKDNKMFALNIIFGEEMDESALNLDNYKLLNANKYMNIKGEAEFLDGNNKVVRVVLNYKAGDETKTNTTVGFLTNGLGFNLVAGTRLAISQAVKDLAGNHYDAFEYLSPAIINIDNGKISKITAVDNKVIEIEFDKEIAQISEAGFAVEGNKIEEFTQSGKKVTLNVEKDLPADAKGIKVSYVPQTDDKDIFGVQFSKHVAVEDEVKDKIKPSIANHKDGDKDVPKIVVAKTGEKTAKLTISYTEKINQNSVSVNTFKVDNNWKVDEDTAVVFDATGKDIILKLTTTDGNDDGLRDLTVSQVSAVSDEAGNKSDIVSTSLETMYVDQVAVDAVAAEMAKITGLTALDNTMDTEEKALKAVKEQVEAKITVANLDSYSVTVKANGFKAPTASENGKIEFTVKLVKNSVSESQDFDVVINK